MVAVIVELVTSFIIVVVLSLRRWMVTWKN
jgi:hypothetical protein